MIRDALLWRNQALKPEPGTVAVDWAHSLSQGLVTCLLLNEGAGNALDLAASRDSTAGVYWTLGAVSGTAPVWSMSAMGRSLLWNNTSKDISTTAAQLCGTAYTNLAWVRPAAVDAGVHPIVRHIDASFTGFNLYLNATTGFADHNETDGFLTGTTAPVAGKIYQVVGTGDQVAATRQIYVNGARENSGALSTFAQVAGNYSLGRDQFTHFWNGDIILFMRWTRVLTRDEVAWLYAEPYTFLEPKARISDRLVAPATTSTTSDDPGQMQQAPIIYEDRKSVV